MYSILTGDNQRWNLELQTSCKILQVFVLDNSLTKIKQIRLVKKCYNSLSKEILSASELICM